MQSTLMENPAQALGTNPMAGVEKAAALLLFLGEEISAQVFKRLNNTEVTRVSQAISKLGMLNDEKVNVVLTESHSELVGGRIKMRGDMDYACKLIESAYGGDTARELIRDLSAEAIPSSEGIKKLRKADPQQLSKAIEDEHPQAMAVILAHLEPDQAAKTLALLDEEIRSDVCMRLAGLERLSQPVRDQVMDLVASRLVQGGQETDSTGGPRRVAEIFNRMDREIGKETLQKIEGEDEELAVSIRNMMFVFDDILLINESDMRKVIQRIDKKVLMQALKGTVEELKQHFFTNMSQRAVEMLEEDMEAFGPIRKREAETARQEIVTILRQMEAEGEISLGQGGGDQYVD